MNVPGIDVYSSLSVKQLAEIEDGLYLTFEKYSTEYGEDVGTELLVKRARTNDLNFKSKNRNCLIIWLQWLQ